MVSETDDVDIAGAANVSRQLAKSDNTLCKVNKNWTPQHLNSCHEITVKLYNANLQ